ncbi:MAG: hypothetical protein ACO1ON_08650 [Nocardioides sp.]|uniref:Unannotated protein n=1 Tax=freshwater metagenome TaxID=449393 RepID=A0A6J6U2T7_9ZZZZ|nr:hypothetical protein [Actinomycetota bacterium]
MSEDLATLIALPVLGLLLLAGGIWSGRHLDLLVGSLGGEEVLERRRATMSRGARAMTVTGAFLVVGSLVLIATR